MSNLTVEVQKLDPSAIISLFTLDTTILGGPLLYFVRASDTGAKISYGGITYEPVDIVFEGLETSSVGALPQPKIRIANSDDAIQAVVNTWGDLNGCTLKRLRTFVRFLDGQPTADPSAYYGPDIYRVEQKTSETSTEIEWTLSASIDQEGKMIPGRVFIRDTCLWRYRVWNQSTNSFDYTKAQCPYTGSQAYDINDQPVAQNLDFPSRRLSCCEKRFGAKNPLPFGGFPGMQRNMS